MFADAIAPGIVVAQAIGRLGNYFNQELYGGPTDLPWGLEIYRRVERVTGAEDNLNGVAVDHIPVADRAPDVPLRAAVEPRGRRARGLGRPAVPAGPRPRVRACTSPATRAGRFVDRADAHRPRPRTSFGAADQRLGLDPRVPRRDRVPGPRQTARTARGPGGDPGHRAAGRGRRGRAGRLGRGQGRTPKAEEPTTRPMATTEADEADGAEPPSRRGRPRSPPSRPRPRPRGRRVPPSRTRSLPSRRQAEPASDGDEGDEAGRTRTDKEPSSAGPLGVLGVSDTGPGRSSAAGPARSAGRACAATTAGIAFTSRIAVALRPAVLWSPSVPISRRSSV